MLEWYNIRGSRTTNAGELKAYETRLTPKPYQVYFDELALKFNKVFSDRAPFSLLRVGDGECTFLSGGRHGNITSRHRTAEAQTVDSAEWTEAMMRNDIIATNVEPADVRSALRVFTSEFLEQSIPVPVIYALLSSRRLFVLAREHGLKIGLIGNVYKLEVIRLLMENPDYQKYLGCAMFSEYISLPQTGSANDPGGLLRDLLNQMDGSSDVYLVGLGIGKLKILSQLRDRTGKIILDLGCGIDALAGCVSHERPFMADWTDFRLRHFSYFHIDQLDFEIYDHAPYQFRLLALNRHVSWIIRQQLASRATIFYNNYRWLKWKKYLDLKKILSKLGVA